MKSSVTKRSVMIDGHNTSVSLEDAFWNDLKEIAQAEHASLSGLVTKITRRADKATYPQRSACSC